MNIAYISLGSNIGDREHHLKDAIHQLADNERIQMDAISSIYETDPVGFVDQPSFFNMVVRIRTSLTADELLAACMKVEQTLGRVREFRWGPRNIDLDILLYNDDNIESENLTVPHPRMHERGFVLIPLVELAPNVTHPVTKVLLSDYAQKQKEGVQVWKTPDWVGEFVRFES